MKFIKSKIKKFKIITGLVFLIFLTTMCSSLFSEESEADFFLRSDARVASLGGSSVAFGSGPASLLANPAVLGFRTGGLIVSASHSELAMPAMIYALNVGCYLPEIIKPEFGGAGLNINALYFENYVRYRAQLSWAKNIKNKLAAGTAINLSGWSSSAMTWDGTKLESSHLSVLADLGAVVKTGDNVRLGLSLRNIGAGALSKTYVDKDFVPMSLQTGTHYITRKLMVMGDASLQFADNYPVSVSLGTEMIPPLPKTLLRAGFFVGNSGKVMRASAGFGIKPRDNIGVDYAFTYNILGLANKFGDHTVGISVVLGKEDKSTLVKD